MVRVYRNRDVTFVFFLIASFFPDVLNSELQDLCFLQFGILESLKEKSSNYFKVGKFSRKNERLTAVSKINQNMTLFIFIYNIYFIWTKLIYRVQRVVQQKCPQFV